MSSQEQQSRERPERALDAVLDYLAGYTRDAVDEIEHEYINDRSPQPPKVIAHVDFSRMRPATAGVNRGGMAPLIDFVAGRRHGQVSMPGWCGIFQDEFGRNIDTDQPPPFPFYRLYRNTENLQLQYIHSSIIGDQSEKPPAR